MGSLIADHESVVWEEYCLSLPRASSPSIEFFRHVGTLSALGNGLLVQSILMDECLCRTASVLGGFHKAARGFWKFLKRTLRDVLVDVAWGSANSELSLHAA